MASTEPLPADAATWSFSTWPRRATTWPCRPSGTEPKIKFYMFTYTAPEMLHDLDMAKQSLDERLDAMEADLRKFAGV